MKKLLLITIIVFPIAGVCGKAHQKTKSSTAKQIQYKSNASDWLYNIEFNGYDSIGIINTTFNRTVENWNFNISCLNIPLYVAETVNPFELFIGGVNHVKLTDKLNLNIGTQQHIPIFSNWGYYGHIDIEYNVEYISLYSGMYTANKSLSGTTNLLGYTVGGSINIIPNILAVEVDYISGNNNISGGTLNILYNITSNIQVYSGVIFPAVDIGGDVGGVIGINVLK